MIAQRSLLGSALLVLSILLCGACSEEAASRSPFVPEELSGTWLTDAKGFEDRALKLKQESFTRVLGEHGSSTHAVSGVSEETVDGKRYLQIFYVQDGEESEFGFQYLPVRDQIYLTDRQITFRRETEVIAERKALRDAERKKQLQAERERFEAFATTAFGNPEDDEDESP